MKKFITAVAAFAVLFAVAPQAQAQAQDTTKAAAAVPQGHPRIFEALLKDITLTDAQKPKVDSIVTTYRDQLPPEGGQMDSSAQQKAHDLVERAAADIRGVLDPDQQKVFDKNLADLKASWAKPSE